MMSSKQARSLMYPLAQGRMATLEGTIGSLHRFPSNQALQYSGAYYAYDALMQDGANLPRAWSPSNSALLNGRNPISHFPKPPLGPPHVAYRPQNAPFPAGEGNRAPPARQQRLSAKQGLAFYGGGSPGPRSPTEPPPGRKHTAPAQPASLSPASPGNPPYLAFPKALLYGHGPCCCGEPGCSAGRGYSPERGPQRADAGEDDWALLRDRRVLLQGKNAEEASVQRRAMQLQRSAHTPPPRAAEEEEEEEEEEEYLHHVGSDGKRTLPSFVEPNYAAYPCAASHSLVVPPAAERCRRLQISPQALHGLYASHPPLYKHMTSLHHGAQSQLYQDRSHMPKYGQLAQPPALYYSHQGNAEVESRATYKDVGGKDVDPSVHKHTPPLTPAGHYLVAQPPTAFGDVPVPGPMAPPNDAFLRGFDHSGSYPAFRMRLIAGQMRSVLERQTMDQPCPLPHGLHMDRPCAPPHSLHMDRPCAPPHSLHMDRPGVHPHSLHMDRPSVHPHSLHMDRPSQSPHRLHMDRPNAHPHSLHMDRPCAPPHSLHMDRPSAPPHSLHMDRPSAPPHSLHMDRPNAPPHSLHMDWPSAPPHSLHMDRPSAPPHSLHMDRPNQSPHSLHMDRPCAPPHSLHMDRPSAPPHSLHMDRPTPSPHSLHMDRPNAPPHSLHIYRSSAHPHDLHMDRSSNSPTSRQSDRALDFSQYSIPRPHPGHPEVQRASLAKQSPCNHGDHGTLNHTTESQKPYPDPLRITGSPLVARKGSRVPPPTNVHATDRKSPKRCLSNAPLTRVQPPSPAHVEDSRAVKRLKVEADPERTRDSCCRSPSMPVISGVFSLAPYRAYLQAMGMLLPPPEPRPAEPRGGGAENGIPVRDGEKPAVRPSPSPPEKEEPAVRPSGTPREKPAEKVVLEPRRKIKEEPRDQDCPSEAADCRFKSTPPAGVSMETGVKEEVVEKDPSNDQLVLVIKKCEPDESESRPQKPANEESAIVGDADPPLPAAREQARSVTPASGTPKPQSGSPRPQSVNPPQPPLSKPDLKQIPPQSLMLSAYRIVLPDGLRDAPPPAPPAPPQRPQPAAAEAEADAAAGPPRPARQHFMELHQILCKLLSSTASESPEQEVRSWLSKLEPSSGTTTTASSSPTSTKARKVSGLLGAGVRDAWLSDGRVGAALQKVQQRLREYIGQRHSPFPHVVRAGAMFVPMLVVKEVLFPQVQGSFIDQVLQEHRVELRPPTLSEEKVLTQLHRRASSSKLRRLLALKHLPEIYPDVLNLFYHSCVCKRLGVKMDGWTREGREEEGSGNVQGSPVSTSPSPRRDSQQRRKDPERARHFKKTKRKTSSVKKRRSKPDSGDLPEEGEEAERRREQGGNWSVVRTFSGENRDGRPAGEGGGGEGGGGAAAEERPSVTGARGGEEPGESWMRPLSSGELSSSSGDEERERGGALPCGRRGHSGMILKLRRVLLDVGRHRGGEERYRAVSAPERRRPLLSEAEDGGRGTAGGGRGTAGGGAGGGERLSRRTAAAASSTPRTGQRAVSRRAVSRSRSLRPVRPRTSLLKIRYCPYLSVCHSAEHRRVRWVLRSAVHRARRAMRMYYPDLVGKRVRHLYEETDKTEVWYRGLVVRVHEQHPNPLKTVFEVQYDSEPGWQYYLELLIDYKKGWLKIDD